MMMSLVTATLNQKKQTEGDTQFPADGEDPGRRNRGMRNSFVRVVFRAQIWRT